MAIDLHKAAKIMVETETKLREWKREETAMQNRKLDIDRERGHAHDALCKCVGGNQRDRAFVVNGSVVVVSYVKGTGSGEGIGDTPDRATVKVLDANGAKETKNK